LQITKYIAKNLGQTPYFYPMSRRRKQQVFQGIKVIDAGAKGKAIAHAPDGRVIFIKNAVPGDIVTVRTYKKRKSFYEGEAIEFEHYSDKRTNPKCSHFGTCGGCKWQFMEYAHQLFYKQQEVVNNLKRLGGLELPEVSPIVPSVKEYGYRNKMEFSFSNNKWLSRDEIESGAPVADRNALGFHIPGMWDKILDIDRCYLQADPSNAIRTFIRDKAIELELPFFDPRKQSGVMRTLMIRTSSTGEFMVLLQFYTDIPDKRIALLKAIEEQFKPTSLLYVINSKANDTIYDQRVHCFSGREFIFEQMEGLRFKVNAKSFYQTNSEQAYELYKVVRDFAALSGTELVYDLYTGTGTIAQFVSGNAKKVVGIEAVPEAIDAARENAVINNINNVSFVVGDMRNVFNQAFVENHGKPDLVITDPPRDGMHKDVVAQLLALAPERIVYVSCNSATQARDLSVMQELYAIEKVQPVDMFPHTHHVETVAMLELKGENEGRI
jgi:23S rRNA (uracil1939-C5)-methyltransferase